MIFYNFNSELYYLLALELQNFNLDISVCGKLLRH